MLLFHHLMYKYFCMNVGKPTFPFINMGRLLIWEGCFKMWLPNVGLHQVK